MNQLFASNILKHRLLVLIFGIQTIFLYFFFNFIGMLAILNLKKMSHLRIHFILIISLFSSQR
jgi:hypothetical protein